MFSYSAICLVLDAARRLGPRPVALAAWHRSPPGRALALWRLRDPGPGAPAPAALRGTAARRAVPPPPPPGLPPDHAAAVLDAAAALPGAARGAAGWHGGFPSDTPALRLDLFRHGDVRPVWEAGRWAELPLLAQAARLDPAAGGDGGDPAPRRAAALLADWARWNPPFRGPHWACGQEAALRALHLALALALAGEDGAAGPAAATPGGGGGGGGGGADGARALLALHGRRIAATPAYAAAQDNNHGVSEPAGLLVCGLLCGEAAWTRRGAAGLDAAILRLVSPCGAFAQPSTGYHRLLLDVAAAAEWLRRRHGGPPLAEAARARLAAATLWLLRLTDPGTGATPRIGHQDGSAFADLSLAGPDDARGSLERAARLFAGRSAGFPADPGCAWLGLGAPARGPWPAAPRWESDGFLGWQEGAARAVLRTGAPRLRFRPGQADLLHLELWDGPRALLRDGGTGAYNPVPPAQAAWWHAHFTGTAAHNTVEFDGEDQMPRAGRFLFARWPRTGLLPGGGGAWLRDHRGRRHERRVAPGPGGRSWTVEDRLSGPFRRVALRWRLPAGGEDWRATPDGAAGPGGAALGLEADAPLAVALEQGWESPAYGVVRPAPVLVARAGPGLRQIRTRVSLA